MKTHAWVLPFGVGLLTAGACTGHSWPASPPEHAAHAAAEPTVLHVAPTGSGSACTVSFPCSLFGARDKVRTLNAGMSADILVNLADGVYALPGPLELREDSVTHDSGKNGFNVIYQPEPGARPILSGGTRIAGFALWDAGKNIHRARVPSGLRTRQLYVNGVRATRARGPLRPPHFRKDPATGWTQPDGSLAFWRNPTRIEVVSYQAWKAFRCPVASITQRTWHNVVAASTGAGFSYPSDWSALNPLTDAGRGTTYHVGDYNGDGKSDLLLAGYDSAIVMQQPCWDDSQSQSCCTMSEVTWLENAFELLDAPGEWYLDEPQGLLYYIPRPGEDLTTMPVVAATLETLVRGVGEDPAFLEKVQFKGLTFAYAGWLGPSSSSGYPDVQAGWHGLDPRRTPGNVTFSSARSLRFEGNIFTHLGGVALNLDSGSQNIRIVGNVFNDISSSGIQIGDVSPASQQPMFANRTFANTIANNYITRAAVEYQGAVGIFVGYSDIMVITHNELAQLPYTGISVGWGWAANEPTCDQSFSYARKSILTRNRIRDVMQTLDDGGGIYTLSPQPESSTDANYISNVGHPGGGQANALYHDQGTCHYTDRHNVVSGAWAWLSMWHPSVQSNTIQNNYADRDLAVCLDHNQKPSFLCGQFGGNTVSGNIFTGGTWPQEALDVMSAAGLEPAYQGIKASVCGDATCNGSETPSTCPKDCR